jgi:anion-transporting  ArsA/GET3 family ATPase
MVEKLPELLATKRLLVVTGKGGAGKSLLSLALAHRISKMGKKVWLVEVGRKRDKAFSRLPELLGVEKIEHSPQKIQLCGADFYASLLDPTAGLAEYVDLKLPTAGLAGILLNNNVTASLLEVVPGLPDLVVLGKLWHVLTSPKAKLQTDLVILDAPATGHAVSFLHSAKNFQRITKVGPIYKDASAMTEFLADAKKTALLLATLPEEMSLQETEEFQKLLANDFPKPFVVLNKLFPALPKLEENNPGIAWDAYAYARKRHLREKAAVKSHSGEVHASVPFCFPEPDSDPLFLRMAEFL